MGIGKKEKDNGILFLTAIQDRKLRIEVGYGLESVVTDAKSAQMIAQAKPLLRAGDYPGAIDQITTAIITTAETGDVPLSVSEGPREISVGERIFWSLVALMLFGALAMAIVAIYIVLKVRNFGSASGGSAGSSWSSSSSKSNASSRSSSSSSSSSNDSFGGGSSGGGGASGSW